MNIEWVPLISFIVVTSFNPGPNNISSASMGVLFGYKGTLRYLAGIFTGFFFVMLLCAFVSSTMLNLLPSAEPILRIVGALYILWLAIGTARASYAFNSANQTPMGFKKGFLLQAVNPKVAVYGLTIFSTFLSSAANNLLLLALLAPLFASIAFIATSTWAIAGAVIRKWLHQPKVRLLVNSILVALLIYCAIDLSGILALL
jgi:cysteine/O-acetylserine efflux protein